MFALRICLTPILAGFATPDFLLASAAQEIAAWSATQRYMLLPRSSFLFFSQTKDAYVDAE